MLCRTVGGIVVALVACAIADPPTQSADPPATRPAGDGLFDPARHLRVADVRPGMTGYGLSVFHGTTIDRFDGQPLVR